MTMTHAHDRTLLNSLGFSDPDKKLPLHDLACQYLTDPAAQELVKLVACKSLKRTSVRMETEIVCPCEEDLKSSRHAYQSEVLPALFLNGHGKRTKFRFTRSYDEPTPLACHLEYLITKGEGKYRTHVGFLDAVIEYEHVEHRSGEYLRHACVVTHPDKVRCEESACSTCAYYAPGHVVSRSIYTGTGPGYTTVVKGPCADSTCICRVGHMVSRKEIFSPIWFPRQESITHVGTIILEVKIKPVLVGDILRQIKLYQEHVLVGREGFSRPVTWMVATHYAVSQEDVDTLQAEGISHIFLGRKFQDYASQRAISAMTPSRSPEI